MHYSQVKQPNLNITYVGGMCATEKALVTMADGSLRYVKDLMVGDLVWNYDATSVNRIVATMSRRAMVDSLDVLGCGRTLITPEHPIYSIVGSVDNQDPGFHQARELQKYDLVKVSVPTISAPLTDDELKFLGFYLGDGLWSQHDNKSKFIIQLKRERKIEFLNSLNVDLSTNFRPQDGYTVFRLRISKHPELAKYLKRCGSGAQDKQLPLLFTPDQYATILDGYFEADGNRDRYGSIGAMTASRKLAYSLSQAGLACGYGVSLTPKTNRERTAVIQGRTVSVAPTYFYLHFNPSNSAGRNHQGYVSVKQVQHSFQTQKVYNIETDGDHTYILNSMGVHNCLQAVREAFGIPARYPRAIDDWNSGQKHPEAPPRGLYVPVYFSLGTEPAGHVAISLPDGRVASSTKVGTNKGLYIHPNLTDLINIYSKYFKTCTYLGWSEEVNDTKVVQGEQEMVIWADAITPLEVKLKKSIPMYNIETNQQVGNSGTEMLLVKKTNIVHGSTFYVPVDRAAKREPFGFREEQIFAKDTFVSSREQTSPAAPSNELAELRAKLEQIKQLAT